VTYSQVVINSSVSALRGNLESMTPFFKGLARLLGFGALSAMAGVLSVALLAPMIAFGGSAAVAGVTAFEGLPTYIRPINASQSSTIYALRNGEPEEIATFFYENRIEIPFEQMSPNLVNAVLATEDPRFYQHGGVDILSLIRATFTNLATFGDGPGASTITMQYVRGTLVEAAYQSDNAAAIAAATEVTVERKLREIRLAIALEKEVSKKDILAGYLNLAFLGNQINGVEQASQYYFGVPASLLNIPQAAYLAGMLKSPNDYKPDEEKNLARGIGRRNYVLQQMVEEGFITQERADRYKKLPSLARISDSRQGCETNQVSAFFCDYSVWVIRNSPEFGATREERDLLLRRGGLEIYTTLDLDVQDVAYESVMNRLPPDNEWSFGTASVSVEVGTGRILAMAQNRHFDQSENPEPGRTSVNFNTDRPFGGSSGFQPGSTYKVFTMAEWLKQGYLLGENLDGRVDEPYTNEAGQLVTPSTRTYEDVSQHFRASCGGVVGPWELGNSGDNTIDNIGVMRAMATSQNTAFAEMAEKLDLCAIRNTAADFGVRRADGTELLYVPATILGTNEIAPLTMAAAFAAVANNGEYCSPIAIDRVVQRRGGEELPVPQSLCSTAVSPEIAAAMTHSMIGVMTGGTGSAANTNDGTPLAGKTGTTDSRVHTWMIGYSTAVATATWVGNVRGQTSQGGKSVAGSAVTTVRHAVWRDIMREINQRYPGEAFTPVSPRFLGSSPRSVPDVTATDSVSAIAQLEFAELAVRVIQREVPSIHPIGTVAYTVPAAGEAVPRGTLIEVYISGGGSTILPDVAGLQLSEATAVLESLGFTVSLPQPSQARLYNRCNPLYDNTVAYGTDPAAGQQVQTGSAIVLIPNQCD
jgi:membrane peptidoglycan carboxypeptidase